jgi:hypothetical protein
MGRQVETAGSTETALDLERKAMLVAIEDLRTLHPALHSRLYGWMIGDRGCDMTEVWQWLADRVDRALGQ